MKKQESIDSRPVKRITVLLAEDYANLRRSLKLLIELDDGIKVVGEARTGREAVQMTGELRPEVIVMDIAMPLLNGLEATRLIMETSPATRVLILSAHSDPEYMKQAMIRGASGYLTKESSIQVLPQAIREVLRGNSYFSPTLTKNSREECQKLFGKSELVKKKTARLALAEAALDR